MGEFLRQQYFLAEEKKQMNENVAGYLTCPVCDEPRQELRINKNRKLYLFCDNGCSLKLNNIKSKRYLPVLLSGNDVRDEKLGLIISACKGKKQNEIEREEKIYNAGSEQIQFRTAGRTAAAGNDNRTTGSVTGSRAAAGNDNNGRSSVIRRTDGQHTAAAKSIFGRAAEWLAADDDDE